MSRKVVITGLGVVSPIGSTIPNFLENLRKGYSGISYDKSLEEKNFVCRVSGIPCPVLHDLDIMSRLMPDYSDKAIKYVLAAGIEAWRDAGFQLPSAYSNDTNDEVSIVVGSTCCGYEYFERMQELIENGKTKRLGSWFVVNTMHSGPATFLSNLLAVSGKVETVSSACASGTESIVKAYDIISKGESQVVLAGGCDPDSPYVWAGFDAMRLMCRDGNDEPSTASRPMSELAKGFVPAAGAGMLVLEELEHAQKRGANIYAEILGGCVNSGGQRNGGSMTLPNSDKVVDCIRKAVKSAGISSSQIDYINGHLTSTAADPLEIANWTKALELRLNFPYINSTKSLMGHALGAAGAIETIATVLQMKHNFIHESKNCIPLHPEIAQIYDVAKIPQQRVDNAEVNYAIKASFGFGDVNACLVLKRF